MSDPTTEEESLISQDDIDKLLDSSSIEEAEDKLSEDDSNEAEELGELSQDDIDQLMNSNVTTPGDPADEDVSDDDDMELISQDDIDQLMNSSVSSKEDEKEALNTADDSSDDDMGELSQDDIDSLMNSNVTTPEDSADEDVSDDDMELISQDDINNLMNEQAGDSEVDSEAPEIEESLKEDIQAINDKKEEVKEADNELRSGEDDTSPGTDEAVDEKIQESVEGNDSREDESAINESEAMDVQDCLIAQETIDDLIKNFDNETPPETVVLDEEPELEKDGQPEPVNLTDDPAEPEPGVEAEDPSDEQDIPDKLESENIESDDTEDFLKPDSDATVLDFDDEDEDVSQEDIDALLLESDDEDDEDDILISQDDIDTLLMAADQEDEDVLGDLTDNEFDSSFDDDLDEEDLEEDDSSEFDDEGYDEDQVVLEGDDEEPVVKTKKKKKKKKKTAGAGSKWYTSKLVIACASALVVLGITVPLAYFIFFSEGPDEETQNNRVAELSVEREIEIETVDVIVREPGKKPGNMILKDFVILASDGSKDMAYITTDISIDYSDQRAYHEIQDNLSFYRDLIYESINKSFVSEKKDEITEADILWIVETTLKKVLPGHYIARVSFKSFKAS